MRRALVTMLLTMMVVTPAFAKNYSREPLGCVPSPNPNVPPCKLDETPLMPSDLEKAAKAGESEGRVLSPRAGRSSGHGRGGPARRGSKGQEIGCVPSPNPNVPPCALDQTPKLPSDSADDAATSTPKGKR